MSKLGEVVNFEVLRALKKKSFWYAAFAPPIIILVIFGISYISNHNAESSNQQQAQNYTKTAKVAIFDQSGLINQSYLARQHVAHEPSEQAGIAAVKANKLDAFFYYPSNVAKTGIDVYVQDHGITFSPAYETAAVQLLKQDVIAAVSTATRNSQEVQILQTDPMVNTTTYKNGQQTNGLASMIAPGIFALTYLLLFMLSAYLMISSTTEEKENRTAEILLTSVKTRALIIGKILSIFMLGLIQIMIIVVPLLIAYGLFKSHITLPGNVSLTHIPLNFTAIGLAALFAIGGYVMITGLLVGMGAMFPSAQDASRYLGLMFIWNYVPIYVLQQVINTPHAIIVSVFSYFPLTAPTTNLLRDTVGGLTVTSALPALIIVYISATLAILFAIRSFHYGAMEYGRRIGFKELFR